MNRYTIVCRLRWPAFLLLTGIIALLDQMDLMSWGRAWPLYLILFGVLALAERAALASQPPPAPGYYGDPNYAPGYAPNYAPGYAAPAAASPAQPPYQPVSTSIVPASGETWLDASEAASASRKSWEEEGR